MSHISSYKADIKLESALNAGQSVEEDPGWEILSEAVGAVAEGMNLDVGHTLRDYYGRGIFCDWVVTGPDMPRGVGINVHRKTGEVTFVCDTYGGYEKAAGEIKDKVLQAYSAICVTRALASLNYTVDVEESEHPIEGKKVMVKGVL